MKPTKKTLVYLIAMALTVLFDLAFGGITTWVLVSKLNGTMLVPDWFFPLCIAAAAVNGVFFAGTLVYYLCMKK